MPERIVAQNPLLWGIPLPEGTVSRHSCKRARWVKVFFFGIFIWEIPGQIGRLLAGYSILTKTHKVPLFGFALRLAWRWSFPL